MVRLLAGTIDFSLLQRVQTGTEAFIVHGSVVTGGSFPRRKAVRE